MYRNMCASLFAFLSMLLLVGTAVAEAGVDGVSLLDTGSELSAEEVLGRSFAHRYDYDVAQKIRLVQRDRSNQERVTRMELAQKKIKARLHSLVRFTHPEALRGTRILTIEAEGRSDDHFAFLKSQQKIRRVRATRSDSFMGTDFSMEDMEKREVSDFQITGFSEGVYEDEPVFVVEVKPVYESAYDRLAYLIAKQDFSNLSIRYFKKNAQKPSKELVTPRQDIQRFGDVLLGTHAYVKNFARKTETHIYLENVLVDPDLDDKLFTQGALSADKKIKVLK